MGRKFTIMNEITSIMKPSVSKHAWRFGYGSNIGLDVLKQKKNLNPSKYLTGTIEGWELYFTPAFQYVEPGWAAVRRSNEERALLHGSAFFISEEEVLSLDRQERGYNVVSCRFVSYKGTIVENVGLYVPKNPKKGGKEGVPSLRYLRLLQYGAREAGLSKEWINHLDSIKHYVTPPEVRVQTNKWIAEFESDPARKNVIWTSEYLSKHNGSNCEEEYPVHVSVMGYIVKIPKGTWVRPSWRGHTITRRNLLQFNGKSLDANDIYFGEPGFSPLPNLHSCSDEEKEFVLQNLESLLHRGGVIIARLKEFLDANV